MWWDVLYPVVCVHVCALCTVVEDGFMLPVHAIFSQRWTRTRTQTYIYPFRKKTSTLNKPAAVKANDVYTHCVNSTLYPKCTRASWAQLMRRIPKKYTASKHHYSCSISSLPSHPLILPIDRMLCMLLVVVWLGLAPYQECNPHHLAQVPWHPRGHEQAD